MKKILTLISLLLFAFSCYPQSAIDKALNEVSSELAEKLKSANKIKILVLYVTDINKKESNAGKYFANAIYNGLMKNPAGFQVFGRDNINDIKEVNNLITAGYIDEDKTKELGKIFVTDATIFGSYTVLKDRIMLTLKAIDSDNGLLVTVCMKDLPKDDDAGALLGINVSSKGFNAPINSNESYNDPETVNKDCGKNKTGEYCFMNSTETRVKVILYIEDKNANTGSWGATMTTWSSEANIDPGQTECFSDIQTTNYGYSIKVISSGFTRTMDEVSKDRKGHVNVEQCKSKTYVIK